MYELVEKILWAVGFIAIGGTLAVMFFVIFAQSIFGSKTVHRQLSALEKQVEQMNEHLKQINMHLQKAKENSKKQA